MIIRESVKLGDREIFIETGRVAKQAAGSCLISSGDTVVLVTACFDAERPGIDFLPLTCDYQEKTFAAGKIPGGFFKREGKSRDSEVLTSRLIDRPCRPLFPKGWTRETQIVATVLSADDANRADVLALTGASMALHLSECPWEGPLAGVRVGRVEGKLIANPTAQEMELSDINIVMSASRDAIVMVEGGAGEVSESDMIDALIFGHEAIQPLLDLQDQIRESVGKAKVEVVAPEINADVLARVTELAEKDIDEASKIPTKMERYGRYKEINSSVKEQLAEEFEGLESDIGNSIDSIKKRIIRTRILKEGVRIDGRNYEEVRPITCEVGVMPRTHGSALFTRGETQALVTTTLGTKHDEQRLDTLMGDVWKKFILHYNFPPYSVGEVKFLRGPGRREIGHGALAERALKTIVPSDEIFPYTMRVVSEILESNGSSSMATVCGGTLSMMDAGVPIKEPVAGIAMGLIKEGDDVAILTDILGDEDHLGDMDFKVTGSAKGITALQMDIKIKGLSRELMAKALEQARKGRLHILDAMLSTISESRGDISRYAPRITTIKVKPDQVRTVIGPGGKVIKGIVDQTGVTMDVEDDGTISLASSDAEGVEKAIEIIQGLTREAAVGEVYKGTVRKVVDFGAFVEIIPGTDGLLHISEMDHDHVDRVTDICDEGDQIEVKVIEVDGSGKIRLSRKELLPPPPEGARKERRPSSRGDRPRGGDRGRSGDRSRSGDRKRGPGRNSNR